MKTRNTILCLFALAAPLRAGELAPAEIPSNAEWLLHADLDAMRASETGKAVFAEIETKHGDKLRAFKRMFSLHPVTDLRDVTLYGDGKKDHAVALIDGSFDKAHMEEVVKAADDYSAGEHSGIIIHTWTDKGARQHAAFASEGLLVFSRQEGLLKAALDTVKGNVPAPADAFFTSDGTKPFVCGRCGAGSVASSCAACGSWRLVSTLPMAGYPFEPMRGSIRLRMRSEISSAMTTAAVVTSRMPCMVV